MPSLVVTGGTGGLGRAVASRFADEGWQVAAPGSAELDVRDVDGIHRYFASREPDLLVCGAGVTRDAPLVRLEESSWDEVLAVNLTGARRCAEAVIPGMARRGGGHVIFISSHSALHPPAGQTAYATAKAALLGLTSDLARLHGGADVRVNVILPGFLETRMTAPVSESRRAEILSRHTLGRLNTPGAVAAFIHHLHHHLPHTSGQVFQLDSRT